MRISHRPRMTAVGLLSLSVQASAVALSDFTPRSMNLPEQCNYVYYAAIPGCTVADFQNSVCSKACLAGLVQVNALVANNCQSADVAETSIIGLFKLGKAIQVLCNVAVVTTTTGLVPSSTTIAMMPMPTTNSIRTSMSTSTTLLPSTMATTTSVMSTRTTSFAIPTPSSQQSTSPPAAQQTSTSSASPITSAPSSSSSSQAKSTSASKTTTSPAEAESIRSGNTNSGGGSPFDNIDNSGAPSLRNIGQSMCGAVTSLVFGVYFALL